RGKPQPNSGKPCRMLVSPPGRTASEFIDRHRQTLIDEFRCGSPWRAHQHPTRPRPKTFTKNKKTTDSSTKEHEEERVSTEKTRIFSVFSVDTLSSSCSFVSFVDHFFFFEFSVDISLLPQQKDTPCTPCLPVTDHHKTIEVNAKVRLCPITRQKRAKKRSLHGSK
ncbi:MAG: hypothetical protein BECKG1743D_GA0114223_100691, partial [Candidatus Kentron sp. G]